ncbi:MAG: galactose-1-phosphate uridylyltransferase [Rhodospirillales bacterium]|nr:galactose-1-phosphate uridylyltransferase [Rhodospirillales bacterium]
MNQHTQLNGPDPAARHEAGADHGHCRFNPLTGEWVFVSRSWRVERPADPQPHLSTASRPAFDSQCRICNADGIREDDGPCLCDGAEGRHADAEVRRRICYSRRHDKTLSDLSIQKILGVVDLWVELADELGKRFNWVGAVEDRGVLLERPNAHPGSLVTGLDRLSEDTGKEDRFQRDHFRSHAASILNAYATMEIARRERIVWLNDSWVALVPFWAHSPLETMLLPRRHVCRLRDLTIEERDGWADILKRVSTAYDRLFGQFFPYRMEWHAPGRAGPARHWQFHVHFHAPDWKSMTARRHWSGGADPEKLTAGLTPENAALRLAEAIA